MQNKTIEELAYLIKNSEEKPIIFLGAGASESGEIPLSRGIVTDILKKYKDNPTVKKDTDNSYTSLMNCLLANERNTLLKSYIDKAKINVTHIYLAQLIKNNFIDYVLTVNFDNLMLRALALYNIYPPTYDMAILKDFTTSTFHKKSVVYLHGQHHGLWLLNTKEEMNKVKDVIPPILNSIKDRPWIFIGYSGNDPIFKHITNLGRFDKGLFWIGYKDNPVQEHIDKELLNKENTNSFYIKGYDSDTFMIKLNHELGLKQPDICEQPFTYLKSCIDNIIDIEDEDVYKDIKKRIEISKKQINLAIKRYEEWTETNDNDINIDLLTKEIIDIRINEEFSESRVKQINDKINLNSTISIKKAMAHLYFDWGNKLYHENLFVECTEKYKEASKLNPKNDSIFNNWATALSDLAKIKGDEKLFNLSFEKYEEASKLNPKDDSIFYNWGTTLLDLAKLKDDEKLFNLSFEKLTKAIELGGKNYNFACLYAVKNKKEKALKLLSNSLKDKEIEISFVLEDKDWKKYLEDKDFLEVINKFQS